ncbi:MAG TPA: plastocyanin/azurin family copper-binding protein [Vicinamibacterales bacterium]|nr:plastocyanin/azurin family copper-binding protein [Vicinamibacterales bacterium]
MKRLLVTLSLAAAVAAVSAAPVAAQTTPPAPAGAAKPAAPATKKPAGAGRLVELTGGDDMKYSVASIAAKPGETLHIVLKNTGTIPKIAMAHNFVALNAGVDAAKFSQDAMTARDTDYVPAARKADVLASTALAGPGETVEVTVKVPAKAGTYPYLCTFPGHFAAGMKGDIVVK